MSVPPGTSHRRWESSRDFRFGVSRHLGTCPSGLAGLSTNDFVGVANTLALVRLGFAQSSNSRGSFTYELFVDATNNDTRRRLHREFNPRRGRHFHRMREPESQREVVTRFLRTVSDADDIQRLRESVSHSRDHVGNQRSNEAVQRTNVALVIRTLNFEHAVVQINGDG